MTKQEQFLWIVQTTILANGVNLLSAAGSAKEYRDVFSASGVLSVADDAIRASELIPEATSAFDAAREFCTYMLRNLRETEEKATGTPLPIPSWFARP